MCEEPEPPSFERQAMQCLITLECRFALMVQLVQTLSEPLDAMAEDLETIKEHLVWTLGAPNQDPIPDGGDGTR